MSCCRGNDVIAHRPNHHRLENLSREAVRAGLRYPVEVLLELLSSGMTHDDILADYNDIERKDLLAALEYAASVR